MILFSDFDGTLYFENDQAQTQANLDAIAQWRAAGHKFCITTGRSYKSVTEQLPQLKELCDYYIVDSGAIILSGAGQLLTSVYFDSRLVADIINFSRELPGLPIPFYYTPNSESTKYKTDNITKLRLWFKDSRLLSTTIKQLENNFPVLAFSCPDIRSENKELDGQNCFIEIILRDYGKSYAIKHLQDNHDVSTRDIVVIGDGLNDYGMVRDFDGFTIASSELSNAHPSQRIISSLAALVNQLPTSHATEANH